MNKIVIFLGLLISITGCAPNRQDKGSLTGHLDNIKDGTVLNLIDLESGKELQKIVVKNGEFKIDFNLPNPRYFGLWGDNPKYEKDRILFWLENSKVTISGKYDYIVNAKIAGSESNIIYNQYSKIEKDYEHNLTGLNLNKSMTRDKKVIDSIRNATDDLEAHYKKDLINFYSTQKQTDVAFFFLVNEITKYKSPIQKSDIQSLFNDLPEKFKLSKEGLLIKDYISLPEIPGIGEKFIDFSLDTPDSKTESISKHLGKYTLLEFWASNCGPCRGKHPKLRNLYKLYHEKGLNIIGISGDDNLNDWINAIKTDSIPWINISDLKGFQNKGFLLYGIRVIPSLILLDQNGIIVDKELERKIIDDKFKDIFN